MPFTEKTVNTDADIKALQRVAGNTNLPVATVGGPLLQLQLQFVGAGRFGAERDPDRAAFGQGPPRQV